MRVAVVSPETSYHRRIDETHRLERLVVSLAKRDHDVTVLTTRWWGEATTNTEKPEDRGDTIDEKGDAAADSSFSTENAAATTDTEASLPDRDRSHPKEPKDGSGGNEGHEPEQGPDSENKNQRTIDGVTYRSLAASPAAHKRFLTSLPTALARLRPDVIHVLATRPGTVVTARSGASVARAPVVAEWYDATDVAAESWAVRQAVRRASRTIVPSRLVHRQLRELGANEDTLRVIPDAVRTHDIESTTPENGTEIVYARRLNAAANLESLLLGLAELRGYDWSATVIGDGPARQEYEQQVRDLRIDDRVSFAGECDRTDRIARYRDSHVFVQTARRCPFATELLWALACGCVGLVEYHADSSAHELVEGRERGFRTTTPQEMADAIRTAGELDRLTVDDSFGAYDEPSVVDRYVSCYENAIDHYGLF